MRVRHHSDLGNFDFGVTMFCRCAAMKRLLCMSAVLLLGVTLANETSRGAEQQDRAYSQEIVDLQQQLQKLAAPAKGRVGSAAMLLETGETVDLHGSKHFPMQSVYKLPIVMAVLSRIDSGQLTLDQESAFHRPTSSRPTFIAPSGTGIQTAISK